LKPLLLPLAERVGRAVLQTRGIANSHLSTPLGPIHTYDARGAGSLPTTVVLHGLGSAATPFGGMLARLRPHVRRLVAPDYPGHGFNRHISERLTPRRLFETVTAGLDATLEEPAIVIGNSLGGGLALRYAMTRPSRVRALILLSPAGAQSTDEEWARIRSSFNITTRAEANAFIEKIYHRKPWFFPFVAHELPAAIRTRAVRDLLMHASNADAAAPDELATLPMPILFMWGRSERLLPDSHYEYFARHLPKHAVIERPDGFGHCPHFDAPGRLTRRILSFVRSAATAGTASCNDGENGLQRAEAS
jgi:pimeloyl-ACP methyl ester carboxylesterase